MKEDVLSMTRAKASSNAAQPLQTHTNSASCYKEQFHLP